MNTPHTAIIKPQSGKAFHVMKDQFIKITDIEGGQSGDLFAVTAADTSEFLSVGVTIDCNGNIYVKKNDFLYSNRFNKILEISEDTVGTHDLLHPTCSQRMYEKHYYIDKPHPSCHQNIQISLKAFGIEYPTLSTVFNFFMNAKVMPDGRITYDKTPSKAGSYIILRACVDLIVAVTSCSVTQSAINNYSAKPLKVEIGE